MKKFGALLLSILLILTVVGCGADADKKPADTPVAETGATDAKADDTKVDDTKADDTDGANATVQQIKDRGVLRVGVKEDVPGFGLRNTETNDIEGYEIDLVKKIAKDILGDETKYELTPVTAKTRGPLLDTGDVDMVIATFTVTDERRLTYNFSTSYYKDAVGFLVKKDAGYTTLGDMDDATIGVAQSATSKDAITAEADVLGIKVDFQEYATYPELRVALDSGRIDAFSVDKSILAGYLDDTTVILDDSLSPQEYAIATRLSDKDFSDYIDGLIVTWTGDKTIGTMIDAWGLDN